MINSLFMGFLNQNNGYFEVHVNLRFTKLQIDDKN
ncbi:MAG: hypothetical protein ACJAVF_004003 [Paraglaciecola sp.]|jgi:hypothetical protein